VLILAAEAGADTEDLEGALDDAVVVIDRRLDAFDVHNGRVKRLEDQQIEVTLPEVNPEEAIDKIGRTALLQFCEPVTNDGDQVLMVRGDDATVRYQSQTCEPVRDEQGNVIVDGGTAEFVTWDANAQVRDRADVVWQPARATVEERELTLTGEYLKPNTTVFRNPITTEPSLIFEFDSTGAEISGIVTERLAGAGSLPLAPFLDGEPIIGDNGQMIAPNVQSTITSQGEITGLSNAEARDLSKLLNTGAFPVPLRVVRILDVTD
jgi:preprotein translocase subunit SecD